MGLRPRRRQPRRRRQEDYCLGLVVRQGRMMWGHKHGALRWAPEQVRAAICAAWNFVVCKIKGHDRILENVPETWEKDGTFHCPHCCKGLTPTKEAIVNALAMVQEEDD